MISRWIPEWRERGASDAPVPPAAPPPAARGTTGERIPPDVWECVVIGYRHGCRFTVTEARRLAALREAYRSGERSEYCADARWHFARWLYQHGRLAG